jgi:hypothetical protein
MSPSVTEATVFYGPIVNPKSTASFLLLPNALLAVAASGSVDWIEDNVLPSSLQDVLARHGSLDTPLIALKHGEFLLPGFVDTHTVRVPSTPPSLVHQWIVSAGVCSMHLRCRTSAGKHTPCITVVCNNHSPNSITAASSMNCSIG